jgi:hypothetical protein
MAAKRATNSGANRASVIEAVKVPLGFFTLGILVMDGILVALAYKAQGFDFTMLVVGALVGFFMLIIMVFVLVASPTLRDALLARESVGITGRLRSLQLSANDMRFLVIVHRYHGTTDRFQSQPTGAGTKSLEQRAADLAKKGLLMDSKFASPRPDYFHLTKDGMEVAQLIADFARPFWRSDDIIF